MAHAPRNRLEQLANAAHLSWRGFAERFAAEARQCGEDVEAAERTVKRWLSGDIDVMPRQAACRVLEHWWQEPVEKLFGPPSAEVAQAGVTGEELVVTAGRESTEHSIAASSSLDPSALETLRAKAQRLARNYYTQQPMTMLGELVRLRNTVYQQLVRTHKPRQKAELYLLAGQACGLLSAVSWDLGNADVAEEQARAAHTYGSVIELESLRAWASALMVTVAFWSGRPRQAADIAETALTTAPAGTARARLHSVNARALALIGARQEVTEQLNAGRDELDRAGDDTFLDHIGGELGFDRSRHALCAGAAYVALGDGKAGEPAAQTAIELFEQLPDSSRWGAGELGAWIDLGAARTLNNDLAGAEVALSKVFALAPERRTEALSLRLLNLNRLLGTTKYRGAVEARRIGEAVEDFANNSLSSAASRRLIGSAE